MDLTQGKCWRVILLFSLPVILSYLLQQVYSISDAAIVGQTLSAAEVAGVNDTNSPKIAHRTIRLFDGQIVEAEGNQL